MKYLLHTGTRVENPRLHLRIFIEVEKKVRRIRPFLTPEEIVGEIVVSTLGPTWGSEIWAYLYDPATETIREFRVDANPARAPVVTEHHTI